MKPGAGLDSESLDLILKSLHDFAADKLPDKVLLELDTANECPMDIVHELCGSEIGIQLLFVPEEFNGMGGDAFDVYRVCEVMARIDLGIATGVLATFLGSDPILAGGTDDQQRRWLTRIADEGILMAYCATEPEAGSDLAAMRSTAARVESDGQIVGYRINGSKQWISNGGVADVFTVLANAPGGPSWFVVEAGAEGFSHGRHEDKHGIRASNTTPLSFEDVYVDADRLVGGVEGQGLVQAQLVFGYTRLMVAAFGLGGGWAALDRAIDYSTGRIQAGAPLSEKQGYTHKLIVPNVVRLQAGRAYIEEVAERLSAGEEGLNTEGAIAKYLASEAGNDAADASIQALGGYGYSREYMVEKIKRDVRITTIYEGTSEIMEMTISRDRWQSHLKTRGQHYHDEARKLEVLHAQHPHIGAGIAALALHALAEALEQVRIGRLTRHQHILFRIGQLIALAEGAACVVRRAARTADGKLPEKADRRFHADAFAAISRVCARDAASRIASESLRWVIGSGDADAATLAAALRTDDINRAQTGLVADMDQIADAVYHRASVAAG
ncbi:MAG TPA: acyl-CoA dehydrogenase family protein [Blastocatellia bacterium]|nr:acyl-CoA dehydrogenase family protein [Blastocatellia bacterium]